MHSLQAAAVSPLTHHSGSSTGISNHTTSVPFPWHPEPIRPGSHQALQAVCRSEATEGGRDLLSEVVEDLKESGTFAGLLWSFHRAEAGADPVTIEDHFTTLCARMYLAGRHAEEEETRAALEVPFDRPQYCVNPYPYKLEATERGLYEKPTMDSDELAILRALLLTHDWENANDCHWLAFADMALNLGRVCNPGYALFGETLDVLARHPERGIQVLAGLAARMFLAGSVWDGFTLTEAEVAR